MQAREEYPGRNGAGQVVWKPEIPPMMTFFLWLLLLFLCWPLALLALIAYPFVWLLLLPFRLLGIAVDGVFEFLRALVLLPARILRGPRGFGT